jgi:membrane-associated protease RseP (regulator of RpoE activity)
VILFALTVVSTTLVGAEHYAGYLAEFRSEAPPLSLSRYLLGGLVYSFTILGILGAHEMGHYVACRIYRVDASLPYFLPAPLLVGTMGAFIRIRQTIPNKRALFDIGVAGPIAGFVVAAPALVIGLALSNTARIPEAFSGFELGEPLLFRITAWLFFADVPSGYSINLHPIGFAAWFGLFATALNLFPVGQLDGGHIAYAVLGRRATYVTLAAGLSAVLLTFVSRSWLFPAIMMVVMIVLFGPRHPRTADEAEPLDRGRLLVALFALIIFVLCFTPAPIEIVDLIESARA